MPARIRKSWQSRVAGADPAEPLPSTDATHPAHDAHPAAGWIRRGETATLKSDHGWANVALDGARSWPEREVVTRKADKIADDEMVACFEPIAERHPLARTITLIADNATGNRAAVMREPLARPGRRVRLIHPPLTRRT